MSEFKVRYGGVWGTPKVKIDLSEYEMLLEKKKILKGIEEQLDSEKWDVSIIGIEDLEPYIKTLQKANREWNEKYMELQRTINDKNKKIKIMEEHFILNSKPFKEEMK